MERGRLIGGIHHADVDGQSLTAPESLLVAFLMVGPAPAPTAE
jgi:hypothetical protein